MSLESRITKDIKNAILKKDSAKLEVCRSIKSEILLVKTAKGVTIDAQKEIEILQRLLKQRIESEKIFKSENRQDLALCEQQQAKIISSYLPKPFTIDELSSLIDKLMIEINVSSISDMGRLISEAIRRSEGRATGKMISDLAKEKLS